jgi:hypothetical protein
VRATAAVLAYGGAKPQRFFASIGVLDTDDE